MFGGHPFGSLFNDPFFQDPFGSLLRDPFHGAAGFPDVQPGYAVGQQQHGQARQQYQQRRPVIEEVHEHGDAQQAGDEPVVEEPDDEDGPQEPSRQRQRRADSYQQQNSKQHDVYPSQQPSMHSSALMNPNLGMGGLFGSLFGGFPDLNAMARQGGGNVSSFSYSSFSSSGPGGVTYQQTHTSRTGPNGVRESQSTVRDGRTGHQSMTIARGLGDKERVMSRTRDASGRMQHQDMLRGLDETEVDRFDEEWHQAAGQGLRPGFDHYGNCQTSQQPRIQALPAAPHSSQPSSHSSHTNRSAAPMRTYLAPEPETSTSTTRGYQQASTPSMSRGYQGTSSTPYASGYAGSIPGVPQYAGRDSFGNPQHPTAGGYAPMNPTPQHGGTYQQQQQQSHGSNPYGRYV